jgi:hypothetical protein
MDPGYQFQAMEFSPDGPDVENPARKTVIGVRSSCAAILINQLCAIRRSVVNRLHGHGSFPDHIQAAA